MLKLIKKKLKSMDVSKWRRKLGTKSVEIREKVDKLVDTTLFIKDYVATVLSPSTRAALAWAGICILLSVWTTSDPFRHFILVGKKPFELRSVCQFREVFVNSNLWDSLSWTLANSIILTSTASSTYRASYTATMSENNCAAHNIARAVKCLP